MKINTLNLIYFFTFVLSLNVFSMGERPYLNPGVFNYDSFADEIIKEGYTYSPIVFRAGNDLPTDAIELVLKIKDLSSFRNEHKENSILSITEDQFINYKFFVVRSTSFYPGLHLSDFSLEGISDYNYLSTILPKDQYGVEKFKKSEPSPYPFSFIVSKIYKKSFIKFNLMKARFKASEISDSQKLSGIYGIDLELKGKYFLLERFKLDQSKVDSTKVAKVLISYQEVKNEKGNVIGVVGNDYTILITEQSLTIMGLDLDPIIRYFIEGDNAAKESSAIAQNIEEYLKSQNH